jgi:serine/threonine protein phosphatase PrpC
MTSSGGRRINEDALKEVAGEKFTLLALADGLGGHGHGALAAHQCVETIASAFMRSPGLSDATLQALVEEADRAVAALRLERQKPASSMRTTLAMLAVCGDDARWAHVGDSRVYWFRQNALVHRTRDHTVAEFVTGLADSSSVAAPHSTDSHRLLRALGAGGGCQPELGGTTVTLEAGDAFLLCSDGVWRLLSDLEITDCLSKAAAPVNWCTDMERRLRARLECNAPEYQDDYSMIAGMVMSN